MEAEAIRSVGTSQKLKRIRLLLILALREMKNPTDTLPKRVLFFGTRFLLVHNLAPEIYVEYANRRLDFIRRNDLWAQRLRVLGCFPFASRFFERLMGAVPLNSKIRDFTRRPIELSVDANN